MIVQPLGGGGWTVACLACSHSGAPPGVVSRALAACVPGCVHQDLINAGLLGAVDLGSGEAAQEWVGHADWEWRRKFDVPARSLAHERQDLVFDCIDTVAEVWLNGTAVGRCANQFHPHRFDVRKLIREQGNELRVSIRAPIDWVKAQEALLGPRPVNGDWTPYPFVRKSACSFGWDWGPRAPSSGITGAVTLEAWSVARLDSVRPLVVRCTEEDAEVAVHVHVEHAGTPLPVELSVELEAPDGSVWKARGPIAAADGVVRVAVPKPARWWPRGAGPQPLHDLRVRVTAAGGAEGAGASTSALGTWRRRIGLRSVALDTGADEHGARCALQVNGQPIFCTGANWIPVSLHPSTPDRDRYEQLLELACEANLNMLRVWGGGIYEPELFYERCDELGIMVWQDFMFACATYPEDAPYPAQVEAEARYQLARLSSHPSVVLWCGGNEDVIAWQSWGFRDRLAPGQTWGRHYWLELLPRLCQELDPTRPYWPESPWSGSLELPANDPTRGDRHTWDLKVEEYRTLVPRFASEFGHQSPSNLCTLREALGADALRIGGAPLAVRQRAGGGDVVQYEQPLAQHFAPAVDFEEWLYQAHLLQARAMQLAITWLRTNQPRSMGCLFWQWNDVWTGPSWSAVDVKLRPKPFWHALQRAAVPRLVSVEPLGPPQADGARGLRAALVNDTGEPWTPWVSVRRLTLGGREIARGRDRVQVPARGVDASIHIERLVGVPADPCRECLLVEADDQRAWWFYRRDLELEMPVGSVAMRVLDGGGTTWVFELEAQGLVRDLWLEPRAGWVRCAPNLLTLLPGERAAVEIELAQPSSAAPALRVHAAGGVSVVPATMLG